MTEQSVEESIDCSVDTSKYKIIFIGDPNVGKTSLIARLNNNTFNENYVASVGIDFSSKSVKYKESYIKLQIWDTAGQERYKSLMPSYVRNSALIFVVFDITNKETFKNISKWIDFVLTIEHSKFVILANKIDLADKREVEIKEIEELSKKYNCVFFEVSALSNEGIKYMFYNSITYLPKFNDITDKLKLAKEIEKENDENAIKNNKNSNINMLDNPTASQTIDITLKPNIETKKKCAC